MAKRTEEDQFVAEFQGFVKTIALRTRDHLDVKCDLDELVAFGNEGLISARRRFDASRGVQFNTFAYYRVRGAMIDGIRRMGYMPAHMLKYVRAAEAADQLAEEGGEAHANSQGRGDVEASLQTADGILSKLTASFMLSAVGQGEENAPETPEERLAAEQLRDRMAACVAKLPEREQALVRGFYYEGRQFEDVAKELGVSKSWASRLHAKALELMKESFGSL